MERLADRVARGQVPGSVNFHEILAKAVEARGELGLDAFAMPRKR